MRYLVTEVANVRFLTFASGRQKTGNRLLNLEEGLRVKIRSLVHKI